MADFPVYEPKKAGRPRKPVRELAGDSTEDDGREIAREPVRELKYGEAFGRDGEILTRDSSFDDQFHVPPEVFEEGWSFQWCRESCYGKEDVSELVRMKRAGWRPVPPDRLHLNANEEDCIRRDGLILMERPKKLTDQARAEDFERATRQFINSSRRFDSNMKLPESMQPLRSKFRREQKQRIDRAMKVALSDVEIPID